LTALKEELSQQIEYGKMMEKSCFDLKSLCDNLTQENIALASDLNEYQEKMEHIKSAVGVKLKASLEEAAKLRDLLAQSNEENENLMKQVQDLSDSLSAAASNDTKEELQYLQNKSAELVASLQKSEIELSRLREYLVEVEESSTQEILSMQSTMDEYKYQIQTLERERDEWHSMTENDKNDMQNTASMLDKSKSEIDQLLTKIHTLESKGKSDQQTIQNLQNVLAQFEACKL
jgi:chromosome segregation ATPase